MCWGCNSTAQKVWSFGVGIIVLACSITLGVLWPKVSTDLVNSQLQLTEYSTNYQKWIKSPFPLYMEFRVFNFTNWEEFNVEGESELLRNKWKNVKPKFEELGPYVFEEMHKRVDLAYGDDDEDVSFNQTKTWWFRKDLSNGSLDDMVTNVNPIALTINYATRYLDEGTKSIVDLLLMQKAEMFTTAKVGEWLFDGFEDGILEWVKELEEEGELPPNIPEIPYERFGWFHLKNESSTTDGRFQIYTGKDDIKKLGMFKTWNGKETLGIMKGECDKIKGTTGEVWPPFDTKSKTKPDATMFIPDVCRSLTLKYASDFERHGIKGWKWVGDDSMFDNGHKYEHTACFCQADESECPNIKPGIYNTSTCQFGAPAFTSFPHFYLADESYLEAIEGLKPEKEKHEMYIALEPEIGLPLDIKARLQINLFMRNEPLLSYYKDVPDVYIPMFWFTQVAELPEDLAETAKLIYLVKGIGMWICYGLAAVGSLAVICGIYFVFTSRNKQPTSMDMTKS
ncbi:protein croquemort-like [Culicoides brevitarsis]|uniref:protein croquemort-like n=1 Tax=Culicoides brevitarsis TaxID=469753 RepID=UPI00307CB868